jgi:hypothetical protein
MTITKSGTFILKEDDFCSNLMLNYQEAGKYDTDLSDLRTAFQESKKSEAVLQEQNDILVKKLAELKTERDHLLFKDEQRIKQLEALLYTRGTGECDGCMEKIKELHKIQGQLLGAEKHAESLKILLSQKKDTGFPCTRCPKLLEELSISRSECTASKTFAEKVSNALERLEHGSREERCENCEELELRFKKICGQLSGTRDRCASLEKIIGDNKDAICKECPGFKRSIDILNQRMDDKNIAEAKAVGATEQAREEIARLLPFQARCASQEARIAMMQPYYDEYRKRLERGKNAVVGADGERGVRQILASLVGGHAEINVTNTSSQAGDLQIVWNSSDVSRSLLLTVEVKTSDSEGPKMVRKDYIDQAKKQVQAQKADAGLLLYSHSVHSEKKIYSLRESRLVVCGEYNAPGQVLSGLLHALLLARTHAKDAEEGMNQGLTEQDLSSTSAINNRLVAQNRALRGALSTAGKSIDRTLKSERFRS